MKVILDGIELLPDEGEDILREKIGKMYYAGADFDLVILKKSLDARDKGRIVYRYRVLADLPLEKARELLARGEAAPHEEVSFPPLLRGLKGLRVVIAGSGPAGLFCALRLLEAEATVEIVERGKRIEERMRDIAVLEVRGVLDPESNVLFGEGGAGTYSDGKLTARTRRPEAEWFYSTMVGMGAPENILYDARPHLGTDRLAGIVRNMRETIIHRGGQVHFRERMTDIIIRDNRASGIVTSTGRECPADAVVLATGHSARDTYAMLLEKGIALEQKGFAVGLRAEHPAELINFIQYGKAALKKNLPAAEYRMSFQDRKTGRGVYTFCMCPGGEIVNSSSEEGRLCTNGMSRSDRGAPFSNAAVVVTVGPGDAGGHPLDGIEFQRNIERMSYETGGGGYFAPAQRIASFLAGRRDDSLPAGSYKPGVRPARLDECLPPWIAEGIRTALASFDRKMKGFLDPGGVFLGSETRTSSPVRIARGEDLQSVSLKGLFPVGEGAGYAGGIVSSAVDGIRAADRIAELFGRGCK